MRCLLGALLALIPLCSFAQQTDVERLYRGLPAEFRRTAVEVHPAIDQRPLFGQAESDVFWAAFVSELSKRGNLSVRPPAVVREARTKNSKYRRRVAKGRKLAVNGREHYRNVRLVQAADTLRQAMVEFISAGHADIDRGEVGKIALLRAQALLEAENASAASAFRDALAIDPTLTLREGFDRPEAVAALSAARGALAEAPPAPAVFNARPNRRDTGTRVYGRMLPDRVEVAIHSAGAIRFESQSLASPDAAQRLAARVWACLPFGRMPGKARLRQRLAIDVGFTGFTFAEAPVGVFRNLGVGGNFSWLLAENLTLDGRLGLTISGRDEKSNLREDILIGRMALAPGFTWGGSRWRGSVNLGIEAGAVNDVVVTTNAACKHFSPADQIPPAICDFDRDIDRTGSSFVGGPILTLGGSLRLVDQIYLAVRLHAASWLFDSADTGLALPVGAEVGLGYRLF